MPEASDPGTPDQAIAAVEAQLGILISRVRSQLRDRAAQVHPDLQPAGYLMLSTLVQGGPAHGRTLAEALGMDKSSVSRQVTAMEALGLVERTVDPADGRAYFLQASDTAKAAIVRIRRVHQLALYERLRLWPPADVTHLADLLARLNA